MGESNLFIEDKLRQILFDSVVASRVPHDSLRQHRIILVADFTALLEKFFDKDYLSVLIGEITQSDLARKKCISRQAVSWKLNNDIKKFKAFVRA